MASTLVDLVKIVANSTGTGAITLGAAVSGYRGVEALTNAKVYSYSIQQNGTWEVGRGTYLASGQQFSRTVLYSSNGGMAIDLSPGAQVAFVALAADYYELNLTADSLLAEAERKAVLASHYAMDSGDTDVPGGTPGDRGAKFWALQSQGHSNDSAAFTAQSQGYANAAAGYAGNSASSANSAAASLVAVTAALATGNIYNTKAAATAALSGIAANAYVEVLADESRAGAWVLYQKVGGVLTYVATIWSSTVYYVDGASGSDSNVGSATAPFATVEKARSLAVFGNTVFLASNAVIKEEFWSAGGVAAFADGVTLKSVGGRAIFMGFDAVPTGSWALVTGSSYEATCAHTFGGTSSYEGSNRLYPGIIYKHPSDGVWVQPKAYYLNDFANLAAGKAFVDANADTVLVYDKSNSSTFTGGWKQGNFGYYANFAGANPTTGFKVLRKARCFPGFGKGCAVEGVELFGTPSHDGLQIAAGKIRNVVVRYTGSHGCEIPGCDVEDLEVGDGNPRTPGYALHQFGNEVNWPIQKHAAYRRIKVINWPGSVFGSHAVGSGDYGGGAGVQESYLEVDDLHCFNVGSMDVGLPIGILLRRPILWNVQSAGFNGNATMLDPLIVQDQTTSSSAHAIPTSGTVNIIGGMTVAKSGPLIKGAGGTINFSRHAILYSGGSNWIYRTGAITGCNFDQCVIEDVSANPNNPQNVPVYAGSGPVAFTQCHLAGVSKVDLVATSGVTVDNHTVIGGTTGMSHGFNRLHPIQFDAMASMRSLGERVIAIEVNSQWHSCNVMTSKNIYNITDSHFGNPTPLPTALTSPQGVAGSAGGGNYSYVGGTGGVFRTSGSGWTQIGSGTITSVPTCLQRHLNSTTVLVGCADGRVYKIITADGGDTITDLGVINDGTWPILGFVFKDTSEIVAYGCTAAQTAGGAIGTTDCFATVKTALSIGGDKAIRCGVYSASNFILGGTASGGKLWYCSTSTGTYASLNMGLGCQFVSLTGYPTDKKFAYVGVKAPSGTNLSKQNARRTWVGYIDATDASPANWTPVQLDPGVPTARFVAFAYNENDAPGHTLYVVGEAAHAATTDNITGAGSWCRITGTRITGGDDNRTMATDFAALLA